MTLICFVTAAAADGHPQAPAGVSLTPTDWSGLYVGVQGGYAWSSTAWTFPTVDWYNDAAGQGFPTDPQGGFMGGHLTLNHQLGPVVVGIEASFSGAMASQERIGAVTPAFPGDQFQTNIQDFGSLTGRLGFAHDNWLLYANGGYAAAHVRLEAVTGEPLPGTVAKMKRQQDGWTVGGGVEYMIMPNVVLGLEYDFIRLGDGRYSTTTTGSDPDIPINVDLAEIELQTFTARLSIKLDWDRAESAPLK